MAIYEFVCDKCKKQWEASLKFKDYNVPCESPCPSCGVDDNKSVRRVIFAPAISYDAHSVVSRIPNGFNDVLTRIKKHAGVGNTVRVK